MQVRVLITGGTFDKHYDALQGELTFQDTHLPKILENVRCTLPVELEINQLIDSLEMVMENRMKILDSCRKAPENRIVVTHGTDTMAETARVLGTAKMEKTVVITGAMIPYTVVGSDALFNLGAALSAVQVLEPGVYIAMNGRIFDWDNVQKNRQRGVFEPVIEKS